MEQQNVVQTAANDAPSVGGAPSAYENPQAPAAGDTLASLGLVDPRSGEPVATPDWKPTAEEMDGTAEQGTEVSPTPISDRQQPAPAQWESDQNPYKRIAEQNRPPSPGQQLAYQHQQLDYGAALAYQQLVSTGMAGINNGEPVEPQAAALIIQSNLVAAKADAQLQADRAALAPAARQAVAEDIARRYSLPNAKISGKDLLGANMTSVAAMEARAATLQETKRTGAFDARRAAGTDRVESASSPGGDLTAVYDRLDSTEKIKLGLKRSRSAGRR